MKEDVFIEVPNEPNMAGNRYLLPIKNGSWLEGILIIALTVVALVIANSGLAEAYHHILQDKMMIGFPEGWKIELSIEKWVNDGLMVIFFFIAGIEMKKEIVVGQLSTIKKATLPLIAAVGGMVVPALIFILINRNGPYIDAWGIPVATDIAYSLGIIALLGKRVPTNLKLFLLAVAIFDDLGAIIIIAIFYSQQISVMWLSGAGLCFVALLLLNFFKVKFLRIYLVPAIILWICFLYSGIHPTIAGVLIAFAIPVYPQFSSNTYLKFLKVRTSSLDATNIQDKNPMTESAQSDLIEKIRVETKHANPPLLRLENALGFFSAFVVIPLFVIVNAGVEIPSNFMDVLASPLSIGIAAGLLVGKTFGILSFTWLGAKSGLGQLPSGLSWLKITGVAIFAAIGFTMSLFITNLALDDRNAVQAAKLSIVVVSFVASLLGYFLLRTVLPKKKDMNRSDVETSGH